MKQPLEDILFNSGVLIEKKEKDWIFGSTSQIAAITEFLPSGDWRGLLPTAERQSSKFFDTMSCVTFSAMNVFETKLNLMKLQGKLHPLMIKEFEEAGYFDVNGNFNFSDRFIAKLSGTSKQGNSLNAVAEAIRKNGLVPESAWPWDANAVFTWEEYMAEIPQEVKDIGTKVFLKWIKINWEWILDTNASVDYAAEMFDKHLVESPIQVATAVCSGWNSADVTPVPRCDYPIAHATMISYRDKATGLYWDYDHYVPFSKMLASDYPIPYALKYVITIMPPTFELVKEEGSAAVYLKIGQSGNYYGIADSEEIPGGDLLKTFSGTYGNASIKHVPAGTILPTAIVGEVKANKF
jgi:hypothetical protein